MEQQLLRNPTLVLLLESCVRRAGRRARGRGVCLPLAGGCSAARMAAWAGAKRPRGAVHARMHWCMQSGVWCHDTTADQLCQAACAAHRSRHMRRHAYLRRLLAGRVASVRQHMPFISRGDAGGGGAPGARGFLSLQITGCYCAGAEQVGEQELHHGARRELAGNFPSCFWQLLHNMIRHAADGLEASLP